MKVINIDILDESLDYKKFIFSLIEDGHSELEFVYSSSFQRSKILRNIIEYISDSLSLNKNDISRLILIVDEMNNNAIEYGTQDGGINKLRVILNKKEVGKVDMIIEVEDTGKGKGHKTSLDMETLRAHQLRLGYGEHDSIRGRGLFMIIVKTVDRLYFKDSSEGGLIVGIKKSFTLPIL